MKLKQALTAFVAAAVAVTSLAVTPLTASAAPLAELDLLSSTPGNGGGSAAWDAASNTLTYSGSWVCSDLLYNESGEDWSAYDEVVVEFSDLTSLSMVQVQVKYTDDTMSTANSTETSGTIKVLLDETKKATVKQVWIQGGALPDGTSSGSVKIISAKALESNDTREDLVLEYDGSPITMTKSTPDWAPNGTVQGMVNLTLPSGVTTLKDLKDSYKTIKVNGVEYVSDELDLGESTFVYNLFMQASDNGWASSSGVALSGNTTWGTDGITGEGDITGFGIQVNLADTSNPPDAVKNMKDNDTFVLNPDVTYYNITVDSNITNGTITVAEKAAENETVAITTTPDEGYKCEEITVSQNGTPRYVLTPDVNGEATFAMLGSDVEITAVFSEISKPCTAIILDKTSISPIAGEEVQINATLTPADTTDKLTWSTTDNKVATVSETGVVTAVAPGTATITATCGKIKAECTVDVKLSLKAISLSDKTASILVGNSKTLTVIYDPEDTTDDKTVTWKSSDTAVATVANGTVTAVAAGTADITATCGAKTATCTVTVTDAAKPCTAITLDKTAELEVGKTVTLTATTTPADTTDELTWKTSDASVATVANGKVTAVAVGTATITATCGAKTATCEVTVKAATKPCTAITLDKTAELEVGESKTLTATTTPTDTTDKLTWKTSDASVATVANGKVTAVAAGTATITATCGAKTATCEVTVKEKEVEPQPSGDAIWEGTHDVGTGWANSFLITADRFKDVEKGDTIKFTFSCNADAGYHQLQINDGANWKVLSSCTGTNEHGTIDTNGTTYELVLNDADLALVKASGMGLNGYGVTYTKVELVKAKAEGEELKPHGNTEADTSAAAEAVPAASSTTTDNAITSDTVASSDAANNKTVSQTSASVGGKYSQRFFMLIDEADVTKYDAVRIRISVTDANGTATGVFKTTKYYRSITIGGSEIKAPEGKVFVAFALKNIPDGATVKYSAITLEEG